MPAITLAGEALIASLQSQSLSLVIDQVVFANIVGLDVNAPVDRAQLMPAPGDIVAQELITSSSAVNNNTVVYSSVLPSNIGTWSFNWMGLYSSVNDTLVAIAYSPLQEKRATVGDILGNVLTKNFAIEFNGAADVTGILIDVQSWQVDYTARLLSMDEMQRVSVERMYEYNTYSHSAFNVIYQNSKYYVQVGAAVVRGIYIENGVQTEVIPTEFPINIYVHIHLQKTMTGIEKIITFEPNIINRLANLPDYNTEGHFYAKVATINATANITDKREYVKAGLGFYHESNMPVASLTVPGITQLSNSLVSLSETEAASALAAKLLKDLIDLLETNKLNISDIPISSTGAPGIVKLNDTLTSASTTEAATANTVQVLKGYIDNINTLLSSSDLTLDTLQEIVNFVKLNRSYLNSLGISSIAGLQNALNAKAAINHTHTGADLIAASTVQKGVVELATATETITGTDALRAVSPASLKYVTDRLTATPAETITGTNSIKSVSPAGLKYVTDRLIPAGTRMLFAQASAPLGWTQDNNHNDKVIRVVNSTTTGAYPISWEANGYGGNWAVTGLTVQGHTLTVDQIPPHNHSFTRSNYVNDNQGSLGLGIDGIMTTYTSGSAGGGLAHSHGMASDASWRPAYLDVITCIKN